MFKSRVYCAGRECPVKKACERFVDPINSNKLDPLKDKYISKCTNQKLFVRKDEC